MQRLDKIISSQFNISRSIARTEIRRGKVSVGGQVIRDFSQQFDPENLEITYLGQPLEYKKYIYIIMNKPRGVLSASTDKSRETVVDLVREDLKRNNLFPVGRLDRNSEGLLIMTNDGNFANSLTHPSAQVNKTYRVTVKGEVDDEKLIRLQEGIVLDGRKTLPCDVFVAERKADRTVLIFIIHEGRNRQIRRMCEEVSLEVMRLKRTEIAGVKLGMLPQGKWRPLNEREMRHLTNVNKKDEEN